MEHLKVADLTIHPKNLEIYGEPDDLLADNIQNFGLHTPIEVDQHNQILSGARRWMAAKKLDWTEIPVRKINCKDEDAALRVILLTNNYRPGGKTPVVLAREAEAYARLIEHKKLSREEAVELAEAKLKERNRLKASSAGSKAALNVEGRSRPLARKSDRDLAAAIVGTSSNTVSRVNYILKPEAAEKEIEEAASAGELTQEQTASITKKLKETRAKLEAGTIGALPAYNSIKDSIQQAKISNKKTKAELAEEKAQKKIKAAIASGRNLQKEILALEREGLLPFVSDDLAEEFMLMLEGIKIAVNTVINKNTSTKYEAINA